MSSAAAKKAAKKKAQRKAEAAEAGATLAVDASNTSSSSSTPIAATVLTAAALKDQGSKAFLEKKFPAAIEAFSMAIDVEKTSTPSSTTPSSDSKPTLLATLYSNRAASYTETFDFDKARVDALECIRICPQWSKGYFRLSKAELGLMNYVPSYEAMKKATQVDKQDAALTKELETVTSMLDEMNLNPNNPSTSSNAAAAQHPEEDKFNQLISWLIAGKARFPALYMKYYSEDYRGVHALSKIPKDDILLEVPLSHIMTSEVAKSSDIGKKIIDSGVDLNSTHSYLASYLLQEKHNPNSFWAPYIRILPVHYRNMPIFFTQEELAYLKGSFSLGKIADRHAELKEEYDNICKFVPDFKQYTLDEFIWARTVVITRIFGLMINGNKTDGLVPMADMLNHKRPRETAWTYDDTRQGFTITSLRALNRGEQIYDSYGRKCNSRFFVNYGFSLEENEDNQAVMFFSLPTSDPQFAMKVRLIAGANASAERIKRESKPRRFQIPMDYNEDVTKECFSFLRFAHAKDSEIMLLSSNEKLDIKKIEPISIRNEVEVINDLAAAASVSLKEFETTVEEDNALLARDDLTMNIRNAVIMRRGEKQVLQYYIDLAKEVIPMTKMPWKDLKKIAAKCVSGKGRFDNYITYVIAPLVKASSA